MKATTKKRTKKNVNTMVTEKIIEGIKKGTPPWVRPWRVEPHHNEVGRNNYRGVNVLLLEQEANLKITPYAGWITFKQAIEKGWHVKKGAKSSMVTYYNNVIKKDETKDETKDADETVKKSRAFIRYFNVFNMADVEGHDIKVVELSDEMKTSAMKKADDFIEAIKKKISIKEGRMAFYRRDTDEISIPPISIFEEKERFYGAVFHELIHWTGAPTRLKRKKGKTKGDKDYAYEELIAELGACFIASKFGLPYTTQHESYIDSWLKELGGDNKYIFQASKEAEKAVAFMEEFAA